PPRRSATIRTGTAGFTTNTRRCHAGAGGACSRAMSAKISPGNALKRPTKAGITTESFGTEVTTGPEQEEMPIHAHLSQSSYYLIVLLGHKLMALPFMSTIELVDPELRDALALWPLLPLTAESLTRRRADALELIAAVPKPSLPDIAADAIHVRSGCGARTRG